MHSILYIAISFFEVIVVDDCLVPTRGTIITTSERTSKFDRYSARLTIWDGRGSVFSFEHGSRRFRLFTDDDDTVLPNRISGPLIIWCVIPGWTQCIVTITPNNLGEVTL